MLQTTTTIHKAARPRMAAPNLVDYARTRAEFSWAIARAQSAGLPGGQGINIAYEAIDRHVASGLGDRLAIRWLSKRDERLDLTYGDLRRETSRFARALESLGVVAGDRVFALAGRVPELYVAGLGALRHRAIFSPMFSAFGPDPIKSRMNIGGARVLVTTEKLFEKKIAQIRKEIPTLEHVILIGEDRGKPTSVPGTHDWSQLVSAQSDQHAIEPTDPETPALLHFTSGTTGAPKGATHVHEAVVMHRLTGAWALDLHPGDVFWCTA
ncbi:MAG: AMP-binding protein, partial [Deltaproteobacteria bacterium]